MNKIIPHHPSSAETRSVSATRAIRNEDETGLTWSYNKSIRPRISGQRRCRVPSVPAVTCRLRDGRWVCGRGSERIFSPCSHMFSNITAPHFGFPISRARIHTRPSPRQTTRQSAMRIASLIEEIRCVGLSAARTCCPRTE